MKKQCIPVGAAAPSLQPPVSSATSRKRSPTLAKTTPCQQRQRSLQAKTRRKAPPSGGRISAPPASGSCGRKRSSPLPDAKVTSSSDEECQTHDKDHTMSVDKVVFHGRQPSQTYDFITGSKAPGWKSDEDVDRYVPTHCCYCGVQCGMYLKVADGKVIGFEPREDFPLN